MTHTLLEERLLNGDQLKKSFILLLDQGFKRIDMDDNTTIYKVGDNLIRIDIKIDRKI